jgi:CRP-like cAMP-binding protein
MGHELFRSLTVQEADRLSRMSAVKTFEAGECIFANSDLATHLYMLMNGSVHLKLAGGASEIGIVLAKVERGELFGLAPLMDSQRYTTTASCAERCEVLAIEARPFRELLRGNCDVALEVRNRVARIYFSRYTELVRDLQAVVTQLPLAR